MKSEAKSADEYLTQIPEKRINALKLLRTICKEVLVGYEESMAYKMPSYKKITWLKWLLPVKNNTFVCIY